MYKVVIVDDEPVIAEGLRRTVDWKKYGCEVAGVAGSGLEGLNMVNELHPDILFSDIRMPHYDGLCMIAALKSEHSDMEITILTGYRDFDYAKEAIRLGVRRYLVKPSKMAEINEAVEAMIEELKAKEASGLLHVDEARTAGPAAEGSEAGTQDGSSVSGSSVSGSSDSGSGAPAVSGGADTAGGAPSAGGKANGQTKGQGNTQAGSFIVRNALNYMEEHYREKLTLSIVAENVYVSSWHLSKLLNAEGESFSDSLNGIRIRKAKELMMDPSLRISDIADLVGFLDLAHFSRIFKKVTGMSANEYRRTQSM